MDTPNMMIFQKVDDELILVSEPLDEQLDDDLIVPVILGMAA